jgi:hypothetical protein
VRAGGLSNRTLRRLEPLQSEARAADGSWREGGYGGDRRRLPRVVQKLLHRRRLTAEEKAELLWRIYELEQAAQARRGRTRAILLILFLAFSAIATWVFVTQPWITGGILDLVYTAGG